MLSPCPYSDLAGTANRTLTHEARDTEHLPQSERLLEKAVLLRRSQSESAQAQEALDPLTHYVIVRADLPAGLAAAQIVHAAGESVDGPLPEGTFAVVLAAKDEAQLCALGTRLTATSIAHTPIHEPDPPWNGALMAIGLAPTRNRKEIRKILSCIPLLR